MSRRYYRIGLLCIMTVAIFVLVWVYWQQGPDTVSKENSLFVKNETTWQGGESVWRRNRSI